MDTPHFRHPGEVAFGDTDASGRMHFPNIFHHIERAEHAFLRKLGVPVFDASSGGWPRARVECHYHRPLRAGEPIETLLAIARIGSSSVTWKFAVHNASGESAASGLITTVRVGPEGRPCPIPAAERAALTAAATGPANPPANPPAG